MMAKVKVTWTRPIVDRFPNAHLKFFNFSNNTDGGNESGLSLSVVQTHRGTAYGGDTLTQLNNVSPIGAPGPRLRASQYKLILE